jgi:SnoaL-like domain
MSDLEARVRRMEDLMEIHQLFVDYGMHLDAGRFEEYSQLFASDGEIRVGALGKAQGRAAIRDTMAKALDGLVGKTYHLISSPMVVLNGDTATSEVMWSMIERSDDGSPRLAMLGRHRDQLVREDGQWKIRLRRGFIDVPSVYPTGG